MTTPRQCPSCGTKLPDKRLAGLCPACAWEGLADPRESEQAQAAEEGQSDLGQGLLMRVPGYEILAEIARGGMGIVYRARQLEPPRTVALKMLLPHQAGAPEMADRFRLEVRALTDLDHPAILPVYQVGEQDRLPFFTMKLATGGTLAQRKKEFAGDWRSIAQLVARLADAVHFAHERGVLHRDLKPGNILFDDANRPYVSDFGLAKMAGTESDLTRSTDFLGTPHYVAPEVAAQSPRAATIASDVYSLGAILYELLAGRPPFNAEGVPALLRKIAEDEPALPSEASSDRGKEEPSRVPRDLEIICLKCLAKEPPRRYASAHDLAEDLRRWLNGRTILARPATALERMRAWARRNPALASMSAALLSVLGAAVLLQAQTNRRLQQSLTSSLLAQAELQRSSGRAGQRFQTLSLVQRAAESRSSRQSAETRTKLRSEFAAALALPDLQPLSRWPVHISHFENDIDFTADLKHYAAPRPGGGFALYSTETRVPVWEVTGTANNPPIEFRLSADGRWVAARFQDGAAELHSTFEKAAPLLWRSEAAARPCFAFDKAGTQFAISYRNSRLRHDVEVIALSNRTVQTILPQIIPPVTLAFDPTGSRLAMASDTVSVWRLADTNLIWSAPLSPHASAITWSPNDRWVAVALDRRLKKRSEASVNADPILLFDAATGRQKSVFAEAAARVERLAFHPSGESLAAALWGGELLWGSVEDEGFRLSTEGSQRALTFSADGKRLGYAATKDEIGILKLATPGVVRKWHWENAPADQSFTMAISRDGHWVVTGTTAGIFLWDARERRAVASLPLPARAWWVSVLFAPDDRSVYFSGSSFGVRRVDVTGLSEGASSRQFGTSRMLGDSNEFMATGWAADGRSLIVTQGRRQTQNEKIHPAVWLWPEGDPAQGRKIVENFPLVGFRAVPGGRWGVSTDLIEPDLWVWNMEKGERVRSLGLRLPVGSEPAANGRWLVTRTREEFVVWEVGTWRAVSRWQASAAEQLSGWLIVSPDSRLLATATIDGRITLRTIPSGDELISLTPPRPGRLADWRFAPDSRRLFVLAMTGQMYEWDLAQLRGELAKFKLDW